MRKHVWGESIGAITFDFSDLQRSMLGHSGFEGAMLGDVLLLTTNRISHMGRPTAPSHLTLSDLERSKLRC